MRLPGGNGKEKGCGWNSAWEYPYVGSRKSKGCLQRRLGGDGQRAVPPGEWASLLLSDGILNAKS